MKFVLIFLLLSPDLEQVKPQFEIVDSRQACEKRLAEVAGQRPEGFPLATAVVCAAVTPAGARGS